METNIAQRNADSNRNTKGLNTTIEILVIDRIFIVPYACGRIGHFINDLADAVDSAFRFDRNVSSTGPRIDCRLLANRGSGRRKGERAGSSRNAIRSIRHIVVHIALGGMRLTPCIFVRGDVL